MVLHSGVNHSDALDTGLVNIEYLWIKMLCLGISYLKTKPVVFTKTF